MTNPKRRKHCQFLNLTDGERVYRDRAYLCDFRLPERPLVSNAYQLEWPPRKTHIVPSHHCVDCPAYQPRKK